MYRTSFNKERKEWSGPMAETVFNPKTSVGNVILNLLAVNDSRIAQVRWNIFFFNLSWTLEACSNIEA